MITLGDGKQFQVNIDIQSNPHSPNVRMLCLPNYQNVIISNFNNIKNGFTAITQDNKELSLDYVRQNLFTKKDLFETPPKSADDISMILEKYLEGHENIIVFGTRYDDSLEQKNQDTIVGGTPPNDPKIGLDDIHFNQGSIGYLAKYNAVYQDGALFVENKDKIYVAFFFAFVEQSSKTDDNGNAINK